VAGNLYAKQGASYPVDVIVIDGKGQAQRNLPAADLPQVIKSYEQLKEKLNDRMVSGQDRGTGRADSGLVKVGKLERKDWLQALADRVVKLALEEENPLEAASQACRALELPPVDSPNQLGDALVINNLDLLTYLNVADNNQWPAVSALKEEAKQALKDVSLADWVELALSQVSVSNLD